MTPETMEMADDEAARGPTFQPGSTSGDVVNLKGNLDGEVTGMAVKGEKGNVADTIADENFEKRVIAAAAPSGRAILDLGRESKVSGRTAAQLTKFRDTLYNNKVKLDLTNVSEESAVELRAQGLENKDLEIHTVNRTKEVFKDQQPNSLANAA